MLFALGRHLMSASYRHNVLGVRMSYDACGTEGYSVPVPYRDPRQCVTVAVAARVDICLRRRWGFELLLQAPMWVVLTHQLRFCWCRIDTGQNVVTRCECL